MKKPFVWTNTMTSTLFEFTQQQIKIATEFQVKTLINLIKILLNEEIMEDYALKKLKLENDTRTEKKRMKTIIQKRK